MTPPLDVTKLADLLRLAAKSEILPRFRRLGNDDVRSKSEPTDLVTEADEAAERLIRREMEAMHLAHHRTDGGPGDPDRARMVPSLATSLPACVFEPELEPPTIS